MYEAKGHNCFEAGMTRHLVLTCGVVVNVASSYTAVVKTKAAIARGLLVRRVMQSYSAAIFSASPSCRMSSSSRSASSKAAVTSCCTRAAASSSSCESWMLR